MRFVTKYLDFGLKPVVNFLKSFFRKEKEYDYPDEFIVVKYTKQGTKYGVFSDESKEIIYFKYNKITERHDEFRVFNYSEPMLGAFRDKGLPVFDTTRQAYKIGFLK